MAAEGKNKPHTEKDRSTKRASREVGQLHIADKTQRTEYIDSCLQRMYEGAREIDDLKAEYSEVTGLIHDLDEMASLPSSERTRLNKCAMRIYETERTQKEAAGRKGRMNEQAFTRMERLEDEYDEAVRKFTETEEYHRKIKSDLRRLDSEREAFYMREEELEKTLSQTHDVSIFTMIALCALLAVLFILRIVAKLNVVYGYMAAILLAAVAIVALYLRNSNAAKELKTVESSINRLILLQNTVKIRYVNNRNLLDYYCLKYGVSKSAELKSMAKRYEKEKRERKRMTETEKALARARQDMMRLLSGYRLRHAAKWLHMPEVIISEDEEEGFRRELLKRRKQLRGRMDYNQDKVIAKAKEEIKRLARKYPRYADEISAQVDVFIREKGITV